MHKGFNNTLSVLDKVAPTVMSSYTRKWSLSDVLDLGL